jgi:uncharacterized protein YcnI
MYQLLSIRNQVLGVLIGLYFMFGAVIASAHVTVKPEEVGISKYQTFTVSVPNEKETPTTGVRLIIPQGLEHVSPNSKPGWNIEIKKIGVSMKGEILNTGEKAPDPETVTELIWTGGSIPEGQRDEFLFSAKVPAGEGEIIWKAYQTYADGEIVAWDQDPNASKPTDEGTDEHGSNPFSVTQVVNDLKKIDDEAEIKLEDKEETQLPVLMSALAVILSGFAIGIALRRKG